MPFELYYGPFHGGDPTQFVPDDECSTQEERARHREACRKWLFGEYVDDGTDCSFVNPNVPPGATSGRFGLGTGRYEVSQEDWEAMNADDD